MIRSSSLAFLFILIFTVTGCSGTSIRDSFDIAEPQIVAQPDAVTAMLAEAATKASNALETLAAVEYAQGPAPTAVPIGRAPAALKRGITVNWVGPVEQITQRLANRSSYKFSTLGVAPPVPIIVSIDAENKPVIEILRDIGLQMGTRADVRVDSGLRIVEIHYPRIAGVGELDS